MGTVGAEVVLAIAALLPASHESSYLTAHGGSSFALAGSGPVIFILEPRWYGPGLRSSWLPRDISLSTSSKLTSPLWKTSLPWFYFLRWSNFWWLSIKDCYWIYKLPKSLWNVRGTYKKYYQIFKQEHMESSPEGWVSGTPNCSMPWPALWLTALELATTPCEIPNGRAKHTLKFLWVLKDICIPKGKDTWKHTDLGWKQAYVVSIESSSQDICCPSYIGPNRPWG